MNPLLSSSSHRSFGSAPASAGPFLQLPFHLGRRSVSAQQITCMIGEGNYTHVHFSDGNTLLVALTLKKLALRLPNEWFARPHRKYLVNLHYVRSMEQEGDHIALTLKTGEQIMVSRRRVSSFKKQIQDFRKLN